MIIDWLLRIMMIIDWLLEKIVIIYWLLRIMVSSDCFLGTMITDLLLRTIMKMGWFLGDDCWKKW